LTATAPPTWRSLYRNADSVRGLLGGGDGTFTVGPDVTVGDRPGAVAVGDFNRDGLPDVAATVPDADSGTGLDVPAAAVRLNNTPVFDVDDRDRGRSAAARV
jgi:hypothetical protein